MTDFQNKAIKNPKIWDESVFGRIEMKNRDAFGRFRPHASRFMSWSAVYPAVAGEGNGIRALARLLPYRIDGFFDAAFCSPNISHSWRSFARSSFLGGRSASRGLFCGLSLFP
jgi:hypothetical protein